MEENEENRSVLETLNRNAAALQTVILFLMIPVLCVLVMIVQNDSRERAAQSVRSEAIAAGHAIVTAEGDFRWLPSVYEYERKNNAMEELVKTSKKYVEDLEALLAEAENRADTAVNDLEDALQDAQETSEALTAADQEIARLQAEVSERKSADTLEEDVEDNSEELEEAGKESAEEPADREEEVNEPPKQKKWFEFWKRRK